MRNTGSKFLQALVAALSMALGISTFSPIISAANAGIYVLPCAQGGVCAVGDTGPDGGKIVYINQDNPIVSASYVDHDVTVVTTHPHYLFVGDSVTIVGDSPTAFSMQLTVTTVFDGRTFQVQLDNEAAAALLANGRIPKQAGWDLLQLAPVGWSAGTADPVASIATGSVDNNPDEAWLTKRSMGSGFSNTQALLEANIADESTDAATMIKSYGSEWFLPSAAEMAAAGLVLGVTEESIINNAFGEYYQTSSLQNESPSDCSQSNVSVYFRDGNLLGLNSRCDMYPIRPMRQISNRVWLNPELEGLQTFAVRTYVVGGEVELPKIRNYGSDLLYWSTAAVGGDPIISSGDTTRPGTVPYGATLHAVWAPASFYVVNFDGNGSTSGSVTSLIHEIGAAEVVLPSGAALTKPGNTFAGWSESKVGQVIPGTYLPPYDVTLYAQWAAIACSLEFDALGSDSGDAPVTIENTSGKAFVLPTASDLKKNGYRLTGWSSSPGSSVAASDLYCTYEGETLKVYPIWSTGTYSVSFSGNQSTSGTTPSSLSYTTNGAFLKVPGPGNLLRTGYTFGGWNDGVRDIAVGSDYATIADVTLYAIWNPKTYVLTFNIGEGSVGDRPDPIAYVVGTDAPVLHDSNGFSRSGYEFLGWSLATPSKFKVQSIIPNGFQPAANRTLYAVWAQAPSCADGGACKVGDVGPGGGKIIYVNEDNPILSISWESNVARYQTAKPHSLNVGDKVSIQGAYPSAYNAETTVTQIDNDYVFLIALALETPPTYESGAYLAKKPGWDYLQFAPAHWNDAANLADVSRTYAYGTNLLLSGSDIGDGFANTEAMLGATIVDPLTDAVTQIKSYGSEWFLPSQREMLQAGQVLASTRVSAQENDFADYYSTSTTYLKGDVGQNLRGMFGSGCSVELEFCNPSAGVGYYDSYFAFRPMRYIQIRAVLDSNFERNAPIVVKGFIGKPNATYIMPEPARPGFTFDGWFDSPVGGQFVSPATVALDVATVATGQQLYAQWTELTTAVTFDGNGKTSGNAPGAIAWLASTGPIALTAGTMQKVGHTFAGWSESASGSLVDENYSPAAAVKLYAQWTTNVYTVEFSSAQQTSGSSPSSVQYTYGRPAIAVPTNNLARVGFKLKGWSLTEGGTVLGSTFTPVSDTILYAVWEAKKVFSNFKLSSSLKRRASSSTIGLVTSAKTPINVSASGKCTVTRVKKGSKTIGRRITASSSKGTCTVTITIAENSTYAAFRQVITIRVK